MRGALTPSTLGKTPMNRVLLLALCCVVQPSAGSAQGFVDVTTSAGLVQPPTTGDSFGVGFCVEDFDGDGDLDILYPESDGGPMRLFHNDGGMVFSDQTVNSGLGQSLAPKQMVPGDLDNDGDLDVYVTNAWARDQLFINDGSGHFTEEAVMRGIDFVEPCYTVSFGDVNRDGWLDIYVGVHELFMTDRLFLNDGDGTFTDITSTMGDVNLGYTYASPFFDYDGDGWIDILVMNDKGYALFPNMLLRNNGDNTFTDVAASLNCDQGIDAMGVDFVDAFNDGGQDLYVSDTAPPDHLFLVWNAGTGMYEDRTHALGMAGSGVGWGVDFFDYDNDMWQDLHVVQSASPNLVYRNPGAPVAALTPWPEQATSLGLDFDLHQYSVVLADFDEDGRLDVLSRDFRAFQSDPLGMRLMRNEVTAGHWLRIRTHGTQSNPEGIGAHIRLTAGGVTQQQYVRSGVGYLTGGPLSRHFGLGPNTVVDRIEIRWPSGQQQIFKNVAADQELEIWEPSFAHVGVPAIGSSTMFELDIDGDAGVTYAIPLSVTPGVLPLPSGRVIPILFDAITPLTLLAGNPVVPNSVGLIAPDGSASTPLNLPNDPTLPGLVLHATALTIDLGEPEAIRTILPAVHLTIQ